VVGRADGAMRLGTCGGIRRRRAQPHGRPFHGGSAELREKKEKRGKGRRRKRRRGRLMGGSRTAATQARGDMAGGLVVR
jgi:hypothetical protein